MRTIDWKQPLGEDALYEVLAIGKPYLKEAEYHETISYYYNINTWKERPSYELIIMYGDLEIYVTVYVLDERFNSEVRPAEKTRIKNLLAAYAIAGIVNIGLVQLIHLADTEDHATTYIIEERDDKDFLNLQ